MGKIAVIFTEFSDDHQFIEPVEAGRAEGYELIQVGLRQGQKLERKMAQHNVERSVTSVSVEDFDGLVVLRRYTLDELKKAKDVVQLVERFMERGKPIWVLHKNS